MTANGCEENVLSTKVAYLEKGYDEIKSDIKAKHDKYNERHSKILEDMKSIPVMNAKLDLMADRFKSFEGSVSELIKTINENNKDIAGAKGAANGMAWLIAKIIGLIVVVIAFAGLIFEVVS